MNRQEFHQTLKSELKGNKIPEKAITSFAEDFEKGLSTGWRLFQPSFGEYEKYSISPLEEEKLFAEFPHALNAVKKPIALLSLNLLQDVKSLYAKLEIAREQVAEVAPFTELAQILKSPLLESLTSDLKSMSFKLEEVSGPPNPLRGRRPNIDRSVATAFIYAMADCILNIPVYPTNEDCPFNRVLWVCYEYGELGDSREAFTYVERCQNEFEYIKLVRLGYEFYGETEKLKAFARKTPLARTLDEIMKVVD